MTKKNTLKFKYIFPNDFCPEYANGAQGGVFALPSLERLCRWGALWNPAQVKGV